MRHKNGARLCKWGTLFLCGMLLLSCSTSGGKPVREPTIVPLMPTSVLEHPPITSCENITIANPADAYCRMLGYTPDTLETANGQMSVCTLPDGTVCDSWAFLAGKCGQVDSYCSQHGYGILTVSRGEDPYSQEYAICLDNNGKSLGPVSELSGLRALLESCTNR